MLRSQLATLENAVGAAIPALMAVLTAFGWHAFSQAQQTAAVALVLFAIGTVATALTWLHGWQTANYNPAQVAAALTTALNLVVAFGSAFGLFNLSGQEQVSLSSLFGALAVGFGLVLGFLHTSVKVAIAKSAK